MSEVRISIVTAYFNRKKLFYNTLLSIRRSTVKNIEVIAVDDGSSAGERLEDLQKEFDFLKVIRLEPEDKWYVNPCVPFNIGFAAARGEIVILQNPECLHCGDILKYVDENLQPNDYFSFASYSLDQATTQRLSAAEIISDQFLPPVNFLSIAAVADGDAGWYNHSRYDPAGFHWCSAISREALSELGGFDDRYALGVAFDDIEMLQRIKQKSMDVKIIDEPLVLHQNHFKADPETKKNINPQYTRRDSDLLWAKNEYLFTNHTLKNKDWRAGKRSVLRLKILDLLLIAKLKFSKIFQNQMYRFKNKWSRLRH
ncbi:MAG: glycosyltransferase [Ferruginibacter sp.]